MAPPVGVGDDRVLRLAESSASALLVSTCCRKRQRTGAAEDEATLVRDVEEAGARRVARCSLDDAVRVLEGHLPAGEVDHAAAGAT